MTYRKALRDTFVGLLLSWRRLPIYAGEILEHLRDGAYALWVTLLLLLGPALALFSPLLAFLVLVDQRKQERARAEAIARMKRRHPVTKAADHE